MQKYHTYKKYSTLLKKWFCTQNYTLANKYSKPKKVIAKVITSLRFHEIYNAHVKCNYCHQFNQEGRNIRIIQTNI